MSGLESELVLSFACAHLCRRVCLKCRVHNYATGGYPFEDVPLVEFMYLVFTRMPAESYRRRLRSMLYLCYLFRALINSLVG